MRNSIYAHWQEEVSAAFSQGINETSLHCISGSVALLALALFIQHSVLHGLTRHAVPIPAYEAQSVPGNADRLSESNPACVADGMQLPAHLQQANHRFRQSLIAYIGDTYKVPDAAAREIVDAIFVVSRKNKMDPLLVLGIIARESSFNQKARSAYGATGLMQVDASSHQALLKEIGIRDSHPEAVQQKLASKVKLNVTAGVRIYKAYEKQYGSAVTALQAYNGAKHDPSRRYAKKVLAMRENFRQMALQHGACV